MTGAAGALAPRNVDAAPPPSSPSPLAPRESLKAATAAAHASAEAAFPPDAFSSRAGYGRALAALLDAHHAVLRAVEPAMGREATEGLRADLDRLRLDLDDLGAAPPEPSTLSEPAESQARALGALYVAEGARLGARVLARRAEVGLGVSPAWAGRFLGHVETGRWRGFVDRLDAALTTPAQVGEAVDGALATFAAFSRAFRRRR